MADVLVIGGGVVGHAERTGDGLTELVADLVCNQASQLDAASYAVQDVI